MRRIGLFILALVVIAAGAVLLPLPIPLGLPLLALGVTLLVAASPVAARTVRNVRARSSRVDGIMRTLEDHAPARIGRVLLLTRPAVTRSVIEARKRGDE